MNALIVYFSRFGNTQRVAEAIADTLKSHYTVRTLNLESLTASDLESADLVIIGCPTHKMNLPEAVRPLLDALPKRILKGTPVAVFDTSYKMSRWLNHFTASKKLARKLRKLGGKLILPPQTFHVTEREGPLYDGELARATAWVQEILAKLAVPSSA